MKQIIADIHCHPTLKPYGNSFPGQAQDASPDNITSLYYYDRQTLWDKIKNRLAGLTNFRQSDFTALKYGGVNLIISALYPLEKGFCRTKFGTGDIIDAGLNLVTGAGANRINFIQDVNNGYFNDLQTEYAFLLAFDGKENIIDGQKVIYKLTSSLNDVLRSQEACPDDTYLIHVIPSFEGTHSLYSNFNDIGQDNDAVRSDVFNNLAAVKQWQYPPPFVTFAHHFYNGFCGHAHSLTDGVVKLFTNQAFMLGEPMNEFGREVIRRLLDNTNGKRILIDVKHMSEKARTDYYNMLDSEYAEDDLPVIASHAAVRGNDANSGWFLDADINFSDTDIIRIGRSGGLFGIQLDKRRIASGAEINGFENYIARRKVLYHAAELIWRQIEYVAELLDSNDLFAWAAICIGSDNDGIVNPVDGIWTSEDFPAMEAYLLMHAYNYVTNDIQKLKNDINKKIDAEEIIDRFMGNNVYSFLQKNMP